MGRLDVALLIPSSIAEGSIPALSEIGDDLLAPFAVAFAEASSFLGESLFKYRPQLSDGTQVPRVRERLLASVALATVLERAKLDWVAIDQKLSLEGWRSELEKLVERDPVVVGVGTTFIVNAPWLEMLLALVRRILPRAKIVVGGYFYASDTNAFMRLDADVLFVGEGEVRFPELVRRLVAGQSIHHISGLYIRRPDGRLDFTGTPEPVDISLCRPDWRLAERIKPAISLEHDKILCNVETQRGCVFKCQFCTFRVVTPSPSLMSPELAADTIMDTRVFKQQQVIDLTDATATFPPERWKAVLKELIRRGGSPHPIQNYARVTDIDDESAELMKRAGVQCVYIGQESGDQRVLDLMRKGTKVAQIAPAIRALSRHKVSAVMLMIIGFPGETLESANRSLDMMLHVNDECREFPPVLVAYFSQFNFQDMQGASDLRREGPVGDGFGDMKRWSHQHLRWIIELSKVPHAPSTPAPLACGRGILSLLTSSPMRWELHAILKALSRFLAIFLEKETFGVRPDRAELEALKTFLLSGRKRLDLGSRMRHRFVSELLAYSARAARPVLRSPGARKRVTDTLVGVKAWKAMGDIRDGLSSYRAGQLKAYDHTPLAGEVVQDTAEHANKLISVVKLSAKHAKLPRDVVSSERAGAAEGLPGETP